MNRTDVWRKGRVGRTLGASDYFKRANEAAKRMEAQAAAKSSAPSKGQDYNALQKSQPNLGPAGEGLAARKAARDATWKRNLNNNSARLGQTYQETIDPSTGSKVHRYKSGEVVKIKPKKQNPNRIFFHYN